MSSDSGTSADSIELTNYTFDEIQLGQKARYSKRIEENDILLFAHVSGDVNPVHLNAEFAASTRFKEPIAHGMLTGAIVSAAIAMELPGPGSIYLGQSLRFRLPVKPGDTITIELEVLEKTEKLHSVKLACKAVNQSGKVVASGEADVMAPTEKLSITAPVLPRINIGN